MSDTATSQPTAPKGLPRRSSVLKRVIPWMSALLVLSAPLASAGEPDAVEIPQHGSLWNWFVGGSGGYLFDNEAEFGALQAGVDLPFEFAGFQQSVYLEVGRFKVDRNFGPFQGPFGLPISPQLEVDVIPVTLNWKLERRITHSMAAYVGTGVGLAFRDLETSERWNMRTLSTRHDEDVVLYGQLFGGVTAHVSEHLELFAGGRAVFMEEPDAKALGHLENHLSETDLLIEAGARITF